MNYFSVKDVASLLSLNEETIRRWIRDGKLDADEIGGRVGYRVSEESLKSCLKREKGLLSLLSDTLLSTLNLSNTLGSAFQQEQNSFSSSMNNTIQEQLKDDSIIQPSEKLSEVDLIEKELILKKKKLLLKNELVRIQNEMEMVDYELEALNKIRNLND